MGLHGYEPRVNTLFGFPRGIRPGGVIFDIPIAGVQLTDGLEQEKTAQFNQQIGLLSSALEHATPEQMFSTETEPADAISAVKALSKANAQGQRIYQMTRDNMASTLPNLNLVRETENEIRTALNAGLTVIAHTDNVSVPGWTGAGYIISNPETGSGAYKISGGGNGGFSFIAGLLFGTTLGLFVAILTVGLPATVLAAPVALAIFIAAVISVVAGVLSIIALVFAQVIDGGVDIGCFALGFVSSFAFIVGILARMPGAAKALAGGLALLLGIKLPAPRECGVM